MSLETFVCVGLYRGRPYQLFSVEYDTDMCDFGEVCRLIGKGFQDQASDFEFAAIVDEYKDGEGDDGQPPGR